MLLLIRTTIWKQLKNKAAIKVLQILKLLSNLCDTRLNPPLQTEVAVCYNSVIYDERVNYDIQSFRQRSRSKYLGKSYVSQ